MYTDKNMYKLLNEIDDLLQVAEYAADELDSVASALADRAERIGDPDLAETARRLLEVAAQAFRLASGAPWWKRPLPE